MLNSKVLVTGSSGFLGSHLVDFLVKEGFQVNLFDCKPSGYSNDNCKEFIGSILDDKILKQALVGCNAVFHFAALADIENSKQNPSETLETNIIGTAKLANECIKQNIKRFIFSSSMYVYNDKGSFYKTSKVACESLLKEFEKAYGLEPTILRFGSLYGPRSNSFNLIDKFIDDAINHKKIIYNGSGDELREYIHVFDAIRLTVKTLSDEFIGKELIISGNNKTSIKEIIHMIKEIVNEKIDIEINNSNIMINDHYVITPYKSQLVLADKLTLNSHIDLGQGLLQIIDDKKKI